MAFSFALNVRRDDVFCEKFCGAKRNGKRPGENDLSRRLGRVYHITKPSPKV
jgi:hypothetical protein